MPLHIVTSRCFLTCEKVTFIKLEEFPSVPLIPTKPKQLKGKKKVGRPKKVAEPKIDYRITVGYYPVLPAGSFQQREPNECILELGLPDKQKIQALYAEIVREVQEQHPSELYLDKLVNKILTQDEFKIELGEDVE